MKHFFYLFVFISFFCALLSGCSSDDKVQKEIIRPVRYQQVAYSVAEKTRSFSGVAVAPTETKLSFRVGGKLETVKVKVGQKVNKNDLIASLDDTDMQLQHEQAKAAVLNAEIQLDTAKANLNRVRELYENNNVALSEYEKAKNQYSSARAEHESRLKMLDLQNSQLSYSKLYSPMTGIIADVPVEKNENVSAGQQIAVLNSGDDIEIKVGIPEAYIAQVKTSNSVSVTFSSLRDEVFKGVVTEVSYTASGSSTYPVRVKLDKLTKAIRPGMSAVVSFTFSSDNQVGLLVPHNAVAEDQHGKYVYVVIKGTEKGFATVERRNIVVGELTNNGFLVAGGLSKGEFVVTSGVSKITDGMKVRFLQ